jgi:hypothetical protein
LIGALSSTLILQIKWLKTNSKAADGLDESSRSKAFNLRLGLINVHSNLKINSIRITSWDLSTNYYAVTNGSRTGSGVFIMGSPRPSEYWRVLQQALPI